MSAMLTFQEQLQALLDENIEKYPDAVEWMIEMSGKIDLETRMTKYERFVHKLKDGGPFGNHPYVADDDDIIALIKWYRAKHGVDLREAKAACEEFILREYPGSPRALRLRYR